MKFKSLLLIAVVAALSSCRPAKYADLEDGLYANMVTNKGEILLQLTPDKTPMTVANFVSLANGTNTFVTDSLKGKKYYNGIVFHRVVPNFVIQAGDPTSTGEGGPGYRFKDEFPKNEEGELLLKHDAAGVLSMANAGPATNGSQFFITHKATPHLDGKHSVFGKVVKGQNVVDSIAQMDTIKAVEIIRLGKDADNYRAAEVFETHFKKDYEEQQAKEKRLEAVKEEKAAKFEVLEKDAKELSSGLKYIITHNGGGAKPEKGADVKVSCAGYFEDGMLFWTNWEEVAKKYEMYDHRQKDQGGYEPFPTVYSDEARLIPGFKEGLQKMNVGDKAVLFIPSHLGYGAQGSGNVIPPNSNLIFEIELVEMINN